MRENPLVDGAQMERGPSDPVGERGAVSRTLLLRPIGPAVPTPNGVLLAFGDFYSARISARN
jgi:hypothetical protein